MLRPFLLIAATAAFAGCSGSSHAPHPTSAGHVHVGELVVPVPLGFHLWTARRHQEVEGVIVSDYDVKPPFRSGSASSANLSSTTREPLGTLSVATGAGSTPSLSG